MKGNSPTELAITLKSESVIIDFVLGVGLISDKYSPMLVTVKSLAIINECYLNNILKLKTNTYKQHQNTPL